MTNTIRLPLLWLVALIAVTITTLAMIPEWLTDNAQMVVLSTIAIAYALARLSIVTRTRWPMWTMLGAGLLGTMLGDALVYSYVMSTRIWPEWPGDHVQLAVAVILAPLFVGGCFVVVGLSREWVDDRGTGLLSPKRWVRHRPGTEDMGPAKETTFSEDVAVTIDQTATDVAEVKEDVREIKRKIGE